MKRYLIAALVTAPALVLSQLALAADMPVKAPPPPPPPPSWTGFYIGAHVGAGWNQSGTWTFTDPNGVIGPTSLGSGNTSLGVVGGFQAGFNWQFAPAWVFGIEGDFSGTTIHDNRNVSPLIFGAGGAFVPNTQVLMHTDTPDLASIRGRIGYVGWENVMFYATGGAAWEREHFTATEQNLPPTFAANFQAQLDASQTHTGWVAGAGVEAMVNGHFLVRFEYLYYGFNAGTTTLLANLRPNPGAFPLPFAFSWANQNVQVARVGFGYKF